MTELDRTAIITSGRSRLCVVLLIVGLIDLAASSLTLSAQQTSDDMLRISDSLRRNEVSLALYRSHHLLRSSIPLPQDEATGRACGEFRRGSGSGFEGRVRLDHDLWSRAGIAATVSLVTYDLRSAFPCLEDARIRMPDGSLTAAETEFLRESRGIGMQIGLIAYMRPIDRIWIGGGLSWGRTIDHQSDYAEQVVSPDGATFLDGRAEQELTDVRDSDDLPRLSGSVGIEYRLPAGPGILLKPALHLDLPILSDGGNRLVRIGIGLALGYRFNLIDPGESTPLDPVRP